jgi:hypothetical protein
MSHSVAPSQLTRLMGPTSATQSSFTHSHETLQCSPQPIWQRPAPAHSAVQSSRHDTEQLGLVCEHPSVQCPVASPHS